MMPSMQTRWDDRRDSLRVPVQMLVRSYDQDRFEACEGDVSIGGARILFRDAPRDRQVEVLIDVGGKWGQARLQGDIIDLHPLGWGWEARVTFVESLLKDELLLARMLQNFQDHWEPWTPELAVM